MFGSTTESGGAVFFRSFNRLLGDIYYDPLDVGLAFKQLSFTRQSELSTLDQPIFNSLYGQENGRLADRIGLADVVLSSVFPPIHQCHQQLVATT